MENPELFGLMTSYGKILKLVHEKAQACHRDPDEIAIISVSKFCPLSSIEAVYQEGCRDFGESRLQEALDKIPQLPSDCRWHLIGTLQTKKIKKALSAFQLIHSVDTSELAEKISQASESIGITTSILLQVNTSGEASKHGLSPKEWEQFLPQINQLPGLRIEGLMTMAPLTDEANIIRECFRSLRKYRDKWKPLMKDPSLFKHLSMGMSHDYLIAIEEGATLLRIGTAIFG